MGVTMKVYLIRVGETQANQKQFLSDSTALTERGVEQIKQLSKRLSAVEFKLIVHSTLISGQETASLINDENKYKLKELFLL